MVAWLFLLCLAAGLMGACTVDEGFDEQGNPKPIDEGPSSLLGGDDVDESFTRTPPPLKLAEAPESQVASESNDLGSATLDYSNISQGYFGVKVTAGTSSRVKIDYPAGNSSEHYPVNTQGNYEFFPLARGNGGYVVTVHVRPADATDPNQYSQLLAVQLDLNLANEFGPYLVNNHFVQYGAGDDCVEKSYEVAAHAKTDLEVATAIFNYVTTTVSYDTDFAAGVNDPASSHYKPDYTPEPDATMRSRTGICYDYAALTAAMLRANGIPTQLVMGEVLDTDGNPVYHAWNMVWIEGEGWIAVGLANNSKQWTRIDPTFYAAAGSDISQFIGDGNNYTPQKIF